MSHRVPLLLPVAALVAACTPTDDDGAPLGDGPLYVAASWVTDVDATNTYVAVFDDLGIDTLDFANAVEVPGWGDAWVHDGAVFVASGDAPKVSRYRLTEAGTLELDAEIGFGSYGVSGAAFWNQQFLTPTKAWLSDAGGRRYVAWNPATMEITGTIPWPEVDFDEGLDVYPSYTDRGGVVVDGLFFHGLYGHDEGFTWFGDRSYVAVWDVATDELLDVIEVPCPMMDVASLADDGFVYLSGWSYMPLSVAVGASDVNCAARIDTRTRTLDEDWTFDYASTTGGDPGSALRVVSGTDGIFAVFHGSGVPVTEGMDMWELDVADDDWEIWSIDLVTKASAPSGLKMGDGSYYESHLDDRYYVYLPGNDGTQVYEHTDDGFDPRFEAAGWMSRLFRAR